MFINSILYQFSSTAAEKKINNSASPEILSNIKELDKFIETAYNSWKRFSSLNGITENKFLIISGYRCRELNKFLGGVEKSPHLKGFAADVYIKNDTLWFQFCKWASIFAKECFEQGIKFSEIIPEGNGKYNWIHISIKDFDGNQIMKSIELPIEGQPFVPVVYGEILNYKSQGIDTDVEKIQHRLDKLPVSSSEIEGEHGKNRMDLNDMPGSYSRCIYIMKRLMKSFGLFDYQAAGILGNLLKNTQGRLSTSREMDGYAGICQWNTEDQIRFRQMFRNDKTLSQSNLMTQVNFLIHDLSSYKMVERIKKTRTFNESCMKFYTLYERFGERNIDLMDTKTRIDCSNRRGYSTSALEIFRNYIDKYTDESLTGYFEGTGVDDGPAIIMGDDTRLWNSKDKFLNSEEINEYAEKQLVEFKEMEELYKNYIIS